MSTETLSITDSIEDLDFTPPCALRTVWYNMPEGEPCEKPADWVGIKRCCGMATYLCDTHLNDSMKIDCGRCNKEWSNPREMLSHVERL